MKHFFLVILLLSLLWVRGAEALEVIGQVKVTLLEPTRAKVQWQTGAPSGSRVLYGESEAKLQTAKAEGVTDQHEVILTGLKPNATYLVKVGTAKRILSSVRFVNGAGSSLPEEGSKEKSNAPPKLAKEEAEARTKPIEVPPARVSWNRWSTLQDHYDRHGSDFNSKSSEDYANQAYIFLIRAIQQGLPAKYDEADDTLRIYDPKTRSFAAYTKAGKTRTYFKANSPNYFDRQPGRAIHLREWFGTKR